MNFLDVRTVLFSQLITDAVCTLVLALLWWQNRKRLNGMLYWVGDFFFQTAAVLLIILRGAIPDWLSLGAPNPLIVAGGLMGLWGLETFIGKKRSQIYNIILLVIFVCIHFYFIYAHPSLDLRNLSLSLGLLVFCFQCTWLMLRGTGNNLTSTSRVVGWVFAFFCLTSLVRIFILLVHPLQSNDFFQTGLFDRLILVVYQVLLILLTFGLALMVNHWLLRQVQTQEEKLTKVFHSSPNAILITRLADGLILDVNRGFEEMTGYTAAEAIGKTTLGLGLWVKESDRQVASDELAARGEVQGQEFQVRTKSSQELTGLFYTEFLNTGSEPLIISSINDITKRKLAEKIRQESQTRYRSLFENMLNGFAYCQMIYEGDRPQDFIYLDVNRAFETLTGLKDVIGKQVSEVIPGILETDPGLIETYGRVALTGQTEVFETYVQALNMWFSISVYGMEKGFFVAVFDVITNRKLAEAALRESENHYRELVQNANSAIIRWGSDGALLYFNEYAQAFFGYKTDEILGKNVSILVPTTESTGADLSSLVQDILNHPEQFVNIVNENVRRDGRRAWMAWTNKPVLDENGQIKEILAIGSDITERRQAEHALLESETKYRHTLETMFEGCQIIGFDWRYIYLNHAADIHNRRPKEELLGQKYMDMWPGIESTEIYRLMRLCMDSRQPQFMENEFQFPDGSLGWFDLKIHPMPEGIVVFSNDISERKQAEQALLDSTTTLDAALGSMTDAIFISDAEGKFIKFNEAFATFHKFKNVSECAKTLAEYPLFLDVFLPSGELAALEQWAVPRALRGETGTNEEYSLRRKDTGETWVGSYNFAPIRDKEKHIVGSVVACRDITAIKQTQQTITNLARFPSENPNPVLRVDCKGILVYANDAAFRMLPGLIKAEGKPVDEILASSCREVFSLQKVKDYEIPFGECVFSFSIAPTPENEFVNLYGLDITLRKLAENALRISEDKFKYVFDYSIVGKSLTTPGGMIQANKAFCDMLGYSEQELQKQSWRDTTHPDDLQITQAEVDALLSGKKESTRLIKRYLHKNGSAIWADVSTSLRRDAQGQPLYFMTTVLDISERKRAEEELKRSNAELEQFAYVASHDLQEPLRMVSSYVQLLKRRYHGKLDQDADEFIDFAADGAERMRKLINDLLAYSRLGTRGQVFALTNCESVLEQALDNLQITIQENKAQISHDPLPEVLADESQLVQLFQNLIGNAIKFNETKPPTVHISATLTARTSLPKREGGGGWGPGSDVWLFSVHDNGIGIDPRYAERIFIIFQRLNERTKFPGTGIGLALCRKIVQRHGGQIWVESSPSEGATFFFTLPQRGDK